jgi:hypothetical protein
MADQGPPPQIRHAIFGHAQAPKMSHASAPRIDSGMLSRGESQAGHAGGRLGGAGGARLTGGGAGDEGGMGQFNDPVISGMGYDQKRGGSGLLGLLTAGQSKTGDQQEALHQRYSAAMKVYNAALDAGATQQQAMAQVVRSDPAFLGDVLVSHPAARAAFQSASDLHDFISGKAAPATWGPADKSGKYQYQIGPDGQLTAVPIPGAENMGTPAKAPPMHLVKGKDGNYANVTQDTQGNVTWAPVKDAQGNPLAAAPTGKPGPQMTSGAREGLDPQYPAGMPPTGAKGEDRITGQQIAAFPQVMAALDDLKQRVGAMGPLRGPLVDASGKWLGTNALGAQSSADWDTLRRYAGAMQGSSYKARLRIS